MVTSILLVVGSTVVVTVCMNQRWRCFLGTAGNHLSSSLSCCCCCFGCFARASSTITRVGCYRVVVCCVDCCCCICCCGAARPAFLCACSCLVGLYSFAGRSSRLSRVRLGLCRSTAGSCRCSRLTICQVCRRQSISNYVHSNSEADQVSRQLWRVN